MKDSQKEKIILATPTICFLGYRSINYLATKSGSHLTKNMISTLGSFFPHLDFNKESSIKTVGGTISLGVCLWALVRWAHTEKIEQNLELRQENIKLAVDLQKEKDILCAKTEQLDRAEKRNTELEAQNSTLLHNNARNEAELRTDKNDVSSDENNVAHLFQRR